VLRLGKLTPLPCMRGAIRITRPEIVRESTGNAFRVVFVRHCGIRDNHETLDLEEAERCITAVMSCEGDKPIAGKRPVKIGQKPRIPFDMAAVAYTLYRLVTKETRERERDLTDGSRHTWKLPNPSCRGFHRVNALRRSLISADKIFPRLGGKNGPQEV
jgi:hypothetical protein